jgi:3-phenylpropionate/trans-cinnamate dioxygenase ferredoxin component
VSGWTSVGPIAGRAELGAAMVAGIEIGIARLSDGSWVAFDNACTHEECPLSEGDLEEDRIVCYCHSSTFDLRSGAVVEGPAEDPLTMFETRVAGDELHVRAAS